MRQAICISFPQSLSSTIILTNEKTTGTAGAERITPRILTNIRINGRNRKFVGTFSNLQQVLKSLTCTAY